MDIYGKMYIEIFFKKGEVYMKKILCMLIVAMMCAVSLPLSANAEDTVNLYWEDGRMATVPVSIADQCRADGWKDEFPYYGKTIWIRNLYLLDTTDIYGTDTADLLNYADYPTYIPVTIVWYDDTDFEYIGGYQKQLKTLIIDLNGTQLKMPFGDFLRGRPLYWNYQMIYWENPQYINGISDWNWSRIQNGEYWIGMTKTEFLLTQGFEPDTINYYDYGFGTWEQWVYHFSSGASYYYFLDGVLNSWQRY